MDPPASHPPTFVCAILGNNTTFTIEIGRCYLVRDLQEKIKAENMQQLGSLDAANLLLYKVNISISKEVMKGISQFSVDGNVPREPLHTPTGYRTILISGTSPKVPSISSYCISNVSQQIQGFVVLGLKTNYR